MDLGIYASGIRGRGGGSEGAWEADFIIFKIYNFLRKYTYCSTFVCLFVPESN